jgi:hypothetical protein
MAEDREARCDERGNVAPFLRDHHGGCTLRQIEQQGQSGKALAASAQDIGRADIAGPDLSDVAVPGEPGQQQPERDRAEEIPENGGGEGNALTLPTLRAGPLPLPRCGRGAVCCWVGER